MKRKKGLSTGVAAANKVVVSDASKKHWPRKQSVLVACALVVVLAVGVTAVFLIKNHTSNSSVSDSKDPLHPEISQKDQGVQIVKDLEAEAPAASATDQVKGDYYQQLAAGKSDAQDYEGAAAAFEKAVKLREPKDYGEYIVGARIYKKLGNDQQASAMIGKAKAVAKTQPGIDKKDVLDTINYTQESMEL